MSALIKDSSQLKQLQDQQALTCDGTAIPRDKQNDDSNLNSQRNDDAEESKINNSEMRQDTSSSDVAMDSAQSSVSKAAFQISTGEDAEMSTIMST